MSKVTTTLLPVLKCLDVESAGLVILNNLGNTHSNKKPDEINVHEKAKLRSLVLSKSQEALALIEAFKSNPDTETLLKGLNKLLGKPVAIHMKEKIDPKTLPRANNDPVVVHNLRTNETYEKSSAIGFLPEGEKRQVIKDLGIKSSESFLGTQRTHTSEKENKLKETESKLKQLLLESKEFLSRKSKSPISTDRFSFKNKTTLESSRVLEEMHVENVEQKVPQMGNLTEIQFTPEDQTALNGSFRFSGFDTPKRESGHKRKISKTPACKFTRIAFNRGKIEGFGTGTIVKNEKAETGQFKVDTFRKSPKELLQSEDEASPIKMGDLREMESPIFFCSQLEDPVQSESNDTKRSDFMSTLQTEELFKQYIQKPPEQPRLSANTLLQTAHTTCLRYIRFQCILDELETISINNSGQVSKAEFVYAINKLSPITAADRSKVYLERVYETIKGAKLESATLEELAGGLSVLCAGQMEEKVRTALICIGSKEGELELDTITVFLESVYNVVLEQSPNSAKNAGITSKELSEMTALQCFDDYEKSYEETLGMDQFIGWFSSQAKTLAPQCSQPNSPYGKVVTRNTSEVKHKRREEIEVDVEPVSVDLGPSVHEFSNLVDNSQVDPGREDTLFEQYEEEPPKEASLKIPPPHPHPSHPGTSKFNYPFASSKRPPKSTNPYTDAKEMQKRWEQFLFGYYSTYGFYPPPPPSFWLNPLDSQENVAAPKMEGSQSRAAMKMNSTTYYCDDVTETIGSASTYDIMRTYTQSSMTTDPCGSSRTHVGMMPQSSRNCTFRPRHYC